MSKLSEKERQEKEKARKAEAARIKAMSPDQRKVHRSQQKILSFKRLASQRVSRAADALASVQQLANRNSYTYDDAQVAKILTHLRNGLASLEAAFKAPTAQKAAGFEV